MASKYSYEQLAPEYQRLWDTMRIIRDASELNRLANKIKLNRAVYQKVQDATGVPWQMVAVIHIREAGEGDIGQWRGVLHNGEKIVGTGRKTRIVPANRGPFSTWHDAAVDALTLKGFHKIQLWTVSRVLWALEPYNGYGYRNKGLRSPYLWASTNHQQPGKYVRDHVFDPNVIDSQIGAAALLKFLEFGKTTSVPSVAGAPVPSPRTEQGTTIATVSTGALVLSWFQEHAWEVAIGTAVAATLVYFIVRRYRKKKEKIAKLALQEQKAVINV